LQSYLQDSFGLSPVSSPRIDGPPTSPSASSSSKHKKAAIKEAAAKKADDLTTLQTAVNTQDPTCEISSLLLTSKLALALAEQKRRTELRRFDVCEDLQISQPCKILQQCQTAIESIVLCLRGFEERMAIHLSDLEESRIQVVEDEVMFKLRGYFEDVDESTHDERNYDDDEEHDEENDHNENEAGYHIDNPNDFSHRIAKTGRHDYNVDHSGTSGDASDTHQGLYGWCEKRRKLLDMYLRNKLWQMELNINNILASQTNDGLPGIDASNTNANSASSSNDLVLFEVLDNDDYDSLFAPAATMNTFYPQPLNPVPHHQGYVWVKISSILALYNEDPSIQAGSNPAVGQWLASNNYQNFNTISSHFTHTDRWIRVWMVLQANSIHILLPINSSNIGAVNIGSEQDSSSSDEHPRPSLFSHRASSLSPENTNNTANKQPSQTSTAASSKFTLGIFRKKSASTDSSVTQSSSTMSPRSPSSDIPEHAYGASSHNHQSFLDSIGYDFSNSIAGEEGGPQLYKLMLCVDLRVCGVQEVATSPPSQANKPPVTSPPAPSTKGSKKKTAGASGKQTLQQQQQMMRLKYAFTIRSASHTNVISVQTEGPNEHRRWMQAFRDAIEQSYYLIASDVPIGSPQAQQSQQLQPHAHQQSQSRTQPFTGIARVTSDVSVGVDVDVDMGVTSGHNQHHLMMSSSHAAWEQYLDVNMPVPMDGGNDSLSRNTIANVQLSRQSQLIAQPGEASAKHSVISYSNKVAGLVANIQGKNTHCADCGAPKPDWVSVNCCVCICVQCSGVHRSLGTHVSKVRSICLDNLDYEVYCMLSQVNNTMANSIWEHTLVDTRATHSLAYSHVHGPRKPKANSSQTEREAFIRAKYVQRLYVNPQLVYTSPSSSLSPASVNTHDEYVSLVNGHRVLLSLFDGCRDDNVYAVLSAIAILRTSDINDVLPYTWTSQTTASVQLMSSAVHVAVFNNSVHALTLLLLNGADMTVTTHINAANAEVLGLAENVASIDLTGNKQKQRPSMLRYFGMHGKDKNNKNNSRAEGKEDTRSLSADVTPYYLAQLLGHADIANYIARKHITTTGEMPIAATGANGPNDTKGWFPGKYMRSTKANGRNKSFSSSANDETSMSGSYQTRRTSLDSMAMSPESAGIGSFGGDDEKWFPGKLLGVKKIGETLKRDVIM
jgi:hypothetical protein